MNLETVMYDHATAKSRGEQIRSLEALLHAILRRHHPNGCEISDIELCALEHDNRKTLRWSDNPQRGTVIVSSPNHEILNGNAELSQADKTR